MEWALSIPHINMMDKVHEAEKTNNVLGEVKFTRMYFGSEFCQRSIPGVKDLKKAVTTAYNMGLDFTFVTPYVTERDLDKIDDALAFLNYLKNSNEVVVNDWGVLLVSHKYNLKPVLGRLLNKLTRDPRLSDYLKRKGELEEGGLIYKNCNLSVPDYRDYLKKFNIERVEIDYLLHDVSFDIRDWGFKGTLYIPYGSIVSGRNCFTRKLFSDNLYGQDTVCPRFCQSYTLLLKDRSGSYLGDGVDYEILQKGNGIFYLLKKHLVKKAVEEAPEYGIDRIVYQFQPV